MRTERHLHAYALAAGVACLPACSNRATDGGAAPAGPDASRVEGGAGDADAGDADANAGVLEGDLDAADADDDATPACVAPCQGTCVAGRCLVTLASSPSPVDLVVDGTNAYFASCASGGAVMSVPLSGGAPVTLASGPGCPVSLAIADKNLYVAGVGFTGADGGVVVRVPLPGGSPAILASGGSAPVGIAVDGASVYWTASDGSLTKVPIGGGAPVVLAPGPKSATRPVLDGDEIYWSDEAGETIRRVAIDGGIPETLVIGEPASGLAIAGDDLVIASGYTLETAPLAGGPSTTIGTAAGAPVFAVAVDDASVYFTSYSTIWKVPLAGGIPLVLAGNQGSPGALVVDDTSVYWTDATSWPPQADGGGGQIMKLSPK